jgi:hypothetical protein
MGSIPGKNDIVDMPPFGRQSPKTHPGQGIFNVGTTDEAVPIKTVCENSLKERHALLRCEFFEAKVHPFFRRALDNECALVLIKPIGMEPDPACIGGSKARFEGIEDFRCSRPNVFVAASDDFGFEPRCVALPQSAADSVRSNNDIDLRELMLV